LKAVRSQGPKQWLSWPLPVLGLFSLLLFCPLPAIAGSETTRIVVVLYPESNTGSPGGYLLDKGIRATFAAGSAEQVEIHNEYLHPSRQEDAEFQRLQTELLRRKYAGRKVDLIIAGLSSGLDLALKYRAEAFPGVPIVACAVDQRELEVRKLPEVAGVPIQMDLAATLELALRFHPDTQRVYVIGGPSAFDVQWAARARETFRAYEDKVTFEYLTGLPMDDLLRKVAHLPDRSIVYYLHVSEDGTGKTIIPAEALQLVAANTTAPIYGHVDTYVGRGIVGGRVFSFESEGKNAARLGLRILAGEKPEAIGIQPVSENRYLFDWQQLQRWGISQDRLPPGSEIRYKESGLWDLYKWHILGVLSLCLVEALLVVGLLMQRAGRRRADERFRQVIEAAPNGMLMIGQDGRIVLANAGTAQLFGYSKLEMLGQPVEMLLPERFRRQHPAHRNSYLASPSVRAMGAGRELFGRRKDGREFPVEIGLSPVQTDAGLFVLASIFDVTERRQADNALRESEGRFRRLADTAPVMVWMSGPDKLCTYFNSHWLDFTGRPLERELGNGWSEGVHADDFEYCLDVYNRSFEARRPFRMEYRLRRFDAEYRWVMDTGVPRFRLDGAFEGYIGSAIDITDEKRLTDELRENQGQLRVLTGRLLESQETERRRIARELHDDLNQSLALLSLELDLLAERPPESPLELAGRMQELSARVKQLSSSVHELSHQLHPAILEQLGLVAAIRRLCKDTQSNGLQIEFSHHQVPPEIPSETALCLYRIVQEALRNVVKHSGAHHASVAMGGTGHAICLQISDDGTGLNGGLADGKAGLGLVSMRERLNLVKGEIAIDSPPSGGTQIDVRVPLCTTGQKDFVFPAQAAIHS
jgi:PAS domain S-box-containing protein